MIGDASALSMLLFLVHRPTKKGHIMSAHRHLLSLISALLIGLSAFAPTPATSQELPDYIIEAYGEPPEIPQGALSPDLVAALRVAFVDVFETRQWGEEQSAALEVIVEAGDPRVAWVITDMMRFSAQTRFDRDLANAASSLLGMELEGFQHWHDLTDHLMAWDVPSFPSYLNFKREIFTFFEPGWEPLMVEGDIDWRLVSWGGVLIDDRSHEDTDHRCNCIPAADNPEAVPAAEADWPADNDIVFGIEVNGEYRAYPRQIMEVREMVNDTLGGRDLAIPYCTLCGAAQAYFTDELPDGVERPILRTSGLLIRSNKVMYDLISQSVFDTFRGIAVTGPLAELGVELEQATVITTDWATWRTEHPQTTVLHPRYALGRNPDFRNTRDADGPIFPIGGADPRLPVHEDVIGVIADSGTPWAFPRSTAMALLLSGEEIAVENIRLELDGGGIRAIDAEGSDLSSHQAFWFAWAQFYPDTELWEG